MTELTPKEVHERAVIEKAKREIKYKKRRTKYGVVVCGWEAVGNEKVCGIQKVCIRNALTKREYGGIVVELCLEHAKLWDEVYERAYNWYGPDEEAEKAHRVEKRKRRREIRKKGVGKGSIETRLRPKGHKRRTKGNKT